MESYYLLFKKRNGELYDNVTYKASMIPVVEAEINKAELAKREVRLKDIEVLESGISVTLDCIKRTQCKMKENKDMNMGGLNRVFEDINIKVDHINEETFDIIFYNTMAKKTFGISALGENAYRNVFAMYKQCINRIKNYKFEDNYTWKRIGMVEEDRPVKKRGLLNIFS